MTPKALSALAVALALTEIGMVLLGILASTSMILLPFDQRGIAAGIAYGCAFGIYALRRFAL